MKKYAGYDEFSEITGIKKGSLYSKVSKREIPHVRLGKRHVLFPLEEALAWLEGHRVELISKDETNDSKFGGAQ